MSNNQVLRLSLSACACFAFMVLCVRTNVVFADVSGDTAAELTEIIVTAQKKEERIQDVPIPITVLNAAYLAETEQVRIQDFFTSVPGLTATPLNNGVSAITIRGLATGNSQLSNPTVGITVDDLPYGSASGLGGGNFPPDLDPSDLQRIEVLRGPQGTLYGANSLGGLIKFVTVDPSTDRLSGRLQADVSQTDNGGGPGYAGRGAVNIPINDALAVRASGFARRDAGYIDNSTTGERAANWGNADGGRLSSLWKPAENFSLKLSATLQRSTLHDPNFENYETGGIGQLQQQYDANTGWTNRSTDIFSAILRGRFGSFDLTSITGYSIDKYTDSIDDPPLDGYVNSVFSDSSVAGLINRYQVHKLTQELRLATTFGARADWLIGVFFDNENSHYLQSLDALETTGAIAGDSIDFDWQTDYHEIALFSALTFHLTDHFDVQLGGRESFIRQGYAEVDSGPLAPTFEGVPVAVLPLVNTRDNTFTYLVTPEFKFSPDLMVYARLASGYRVGGPNSDAAFLRVPLSYHPDKTQSYDVGIKGNLIPQWLSIDASVYYVDWRDVQVPISNDIGFGWVVNGTRAKSEGVEFQVSSRPLSGLTLTGWVDYDNAVLVNALPISNDPTQPSVPAGQRLPESPGISGNLAAKEQFTIVSGVTGFVNGALSYQGKRSIGFVVGEPTPLYLPAYTKLDMQAGAQIHDWTATVFATNLTNRRAEYAGSAAPPPPAFELAQPRTIGVTVVTSF